MKVFIGLLAIGTATFLTAQSSSALAADFVASEQVLFTSSNPDVVVARTVADIRTVFEDYVPALDSSTTITTPKRVSGSAAEPILQLSMQKCVLIVCKTVDLYADVSIHPAPSRPGQCTKNFIMHADIHRSSALLSDEYSSLDVDICYNKTSSGGKVDLTATLDRAANYASGIVQQQIFSFLKMQVDPIKVAITEALKSNGAGE